MSRESIIDANVLEAARMRLKWVGRDEAIRHLIQVEPELEEAISRIAVHALEGLEDSPSNEANSAAFDAVWRAALLALEAYRLGHYLLWRGTTHGTLLAQLGHGGDEIENPPGGDSGGAAGG